MGRKDGGRVGELQFWCFKYDRLGRLHGEWTPETHKTECADPGARVSGESICEDRGKASVDGGQAAVEETSSLRRLAQTV